MDDEVKTQEEIDREKAEHDDAVKKAQAAWYPPTPDALKPPPVVVAKPPVVAPIVKPVDPVEAARLAEVKHKHDEMLKEYREIQALHMKEATESDEVLERYLGHERRHADAIASMPKAKPVYVYGPKECHPVPQVVGSECSNCGWVFGGKAVKDREPHATA